jgi:hypothetical protein
VAGSCENDGESLGFRKGEELVDYLSGCQLLKGSVFEEMLLL